MSSTAFTDRAAATPRAVGTTRARGAASRRSSTGRELLQLADLVALLVFGFGGGAIAVGAGLGLVGALGAAILSALGGGVIRDLVLGDTPPATLRTPLCPLVAFLGGAVAFALRDDLHAIPLWLLTGLDAAALALFCVMGAAKVLDHGAGMHLAVLLGTSSAVGGGTVRDLLLGRLPLAVFSDLCAVSAAAGAATTAICTVLGVRRPIALAVGAGVCFAVRIVSDWQHWTLVHI